MTARQDRELIAAAVPLSCPIDRYPLNVADHGSAHHRRVCSKCGAVVLFPRVELVRALRRAKRIPR